MKILHPNHIKAFLTDLIRHLILVDLILILVLALVSVQVSAFQQDNAVVLPANSHARVYRDGWECERGYHAVDKNCLAIKVPVNGYLTNSSYGPGWECDQPYRKQSNKCLFE